MKNNNLIEELTKIESGRYGEISVARKFIHYGIPVYQPVLDNGVDLLVELNGRLQKVQVKSSRQIDYDSKGNEIVTFSLYKSKRKLQNSKYLSESIKYSNTDIDLFALYDVNNDKIYSLNRKDYNHESITIKNGYHINNDISFDNVIKQYLTNKE